MNQLHPFNKVERWVWFLLLAVVIIELQRETQ
jgi:hypothetical protein